MDTLFPDLEQPQRIVSSPNAPLAERLRPHTFADVLGQEHLLGEGAPLAGFAEHGVFPSMILWGAPGTGKTTLALLIAQRANADFIRLSAVEAGVKEVREIIAGAEKRQRRGAQTLLFIDEIHRFNKNQQDALLHAVEQGVITLIGATTENPSFEVNAALLSRCRVYTLRPLEEKHTAILIQRALKRLSDDIGRSIVEEEGANLAQMLFRLTSGDGRGVLNALESAVNLVAYGAGANSLGANDFGAAQQNAEAAAPFVISQASIETALQQKTPRYDKKGEGHYDTISAFIKSLRGSDPDAALFWLAVMLEAGEDARFIARRMLIFASEDVGNAAPEALSLALAVFQAVDVIGMPECRINLAQGVTFLASCPKSNASYLAIERVLADVRSGANTTVPLHLRNAPTKLMKQEGYGSAYKYPHDFDGHFVEETYFPDHDRRYYEPTAMGKEQETKRRLEYLRPERYR